jgi:hypothetical protein
MKSILSAAALMIATTSAAFIAAPAQAQVNLNIIIGDAPPPPRYEVVPAGRPGQVWAPGFWSWDGRRHVWQQGHWERARQGEVYVRPEWVRADNGWRLREGGWRRDAQPRYESHERHERHERHESHERHDHDRDERRGGHCPPGQAKKGNC